MDEELVEYVRTNREAGFSDEAIIGRLREGGLDEQEIQELFAQANSPQKETKEYVPAGFFRRAIASLIDIALLGTFLLTASFIDVALNPPTGLEQYSPSTGLFVMYFLLTLGYAAYEILLTASSWEGTLGKRLFGLTVHTKQGERLPVTISVARFFLKHILFITTPAVAFTERKQGVHDMILKTVVVRKQ